MTESPRRLKIGIAIDHVHKTGGTQRSTWELAQRLGEHHDVTLITKKSSAAGLEKFRCHIVRGWFLKIPYLSNLVFAWKVSRLKEKLGLDILNVQGSNGLWQDVVTAQSVHKKWFVWSLQNTSIFSKAWFLKVMNPIHYVVICLETLQYSKPFHKKIIAISEQVKKDLVSFFALNSDRIDVVHHGVNIDEFYPDKGSAAALLIRSQLGLGSQAKVAIFVAHEFRRKGLSVILEALVKCKPENELHLIVVGRDDFAPFAATATNLGVWNRVHFVGPQSQLRDWYAAADFFVFPTSYEAFGMVITEALASGLPVIVPADAGAAELLKHGVGGLLMDRWNHVEQLAEYMNMLCNFEFCSNMSIAARRVAEMRTWDEAARETLEVFKRTLTPQ